MFRLSAGNLAVPKIAHGFFGRAGGVSSGIFASLNCGPGSGDNRENVAENRRRALDQLTPGNTAKLLTLFQIHSAEAVTVTEPWEMGHGPRADAMVTNIPGLALGILTADCAPVLLADSEAGVVAAAHAGWKGALSGITDSTIATMEKLGAHRNRIAAAAGPCISQDNYEVGPEFIGRFCEHDPASARFFAAGDRPDHFRFDLRAYVTHRLKSAGVKGVEAIAGCTYAQEADFFSFRRATHRGEVDYGRQLAAILLNG